MMLVYLMQHAKAKPESEDPEEGLTEDGKETTKKMGKILSHLEVSPDFIICSPKKRSIETANILLEEFDLSPDKCKETEAIKAKKEASETIQYIDSLGKLSSLLIVGHLPNLEKLALQLTQANIAFKNSGCLLLEVEDPKKGNAKIRWYLPPDL